MGQEPLVIQEIDAGAELVRRLDRSFPVAAAFWVKGDDQGSWYLYIASDAISGKNIDVGYGEVMRVAAEMDDPDLDPFRVKLIAAADPLARAAVEIHRLYPATRAIRMGGQSFGGIGVDGVHLYPASITAPTP